MKANTLGFSFDDYTKQFMEELIKYYAEHNGLSNVNPSMATTQNEPSISKQGGLAIAKIFHTINEIRRKVAESNSTKLLALLNKFLSNDIVKNYITDNSISENIEKSGSWWNGVMQMFTTSGEYSRTSQVRTLLTEINKMRTHSGSIELDWESKLDSLNRHPASYTNN